MKLEERTSVSIAEKLRAKADGLQSKIDHLAAPRMVNTRKRRQEDEGRQRDLRKLRATQAVMRTLADMSDGCGMPPLFQAIPAATSKYESWVGQVLSGQRDYDEYGGRSRGEDPGSRLDAYGKAVRLIMLACGALHEGPDEKLRRLERDVVPGSIPGYFPTPRPVVELMIELAEIENGMTILEPSAGMGHIVDVLAERFPLNRIDVCEYSNRLREILVAKERYTSMIGPDILEISLDRWLPIGGYDRIIANPPFEGGQDIQHVRHCFDHLLKHGGRLVSVMAPGFTFRKERKFTEFREWFESHTGHVEKLPDDSFKASGTGVGSVLVVIDKGAL